MTQEELDLRLAENFRRGAELLLVPKRAYLAEIEESIRTEEYGPRGPVDIPIEVETVAGHALHEAQYLRWRSGNPLNYTPHGSTLEGVMHLALLVAVEVACEAPAQHEYCYGARRRGRPHRGWVREQGDSRDIIAICTQHNVGRYKLDFLLTGYLWEPDTLETVRMAGVEVDGHDFHERTKEQAARDKKRDREIQRDGLIVLRFTGSEVFADPVGCAVQVVDTVLGRRVGQE